MATNERKAVLFSVAHRAHKIRLYLSNGQEVYLRRTCGVARFAYNWGLNLWNERRKAGLSMKQEILIGG